MEDNEQMNRTSRFDIYEWENNRPILDFIYMIIAMMVTAFIFLAPVVAFAYLLAQGILEIIALM